MKVVEQDALKEEATLLELQQAHKEEREETFKYKNRTHLDIMILGAQLEAF